MNQATLSRLENQKRQAFITFKSFDPEHPLAELFSAETFISSFS